MFKNWGNNLPFITQNRNSCLWWGGVRLGHPGHQLKKLSSITEIRNSFKK
jgi:hypothetical protein